MTMTKERYRKILNQYSTLFVKDTDVLDALDFAAELLKEEARAIQKEYPYATKSINRLRDASHELYRAASEIDNDMWEE